MRKGVGNLTKEELRWQIQSVKDQISQANQEMEKHGIEANRLQLLRDVSGAFRPGVLTALVGVTGAGKTTLMDVLAGRKTGGFAGIQRKMQFQSRKLLGICPAPEEQAQWNQRDCRSYEVR